MNELRKRLVYGRTKDEEQKLFNREPVKPLKQSGDLIYRASE